MMIIEVNVSDGVQEQDFEGRIDLPASTHLRVVWQSTTLALLGCVTSLDAESL